MKLSKRLFTLCLSVGFICLTMAQEASNFTLNGKVKGQNSGQVVLSYMTSKGYRQDTVSIVDGVFIFSGMITEPTKACLNNSNVSFWIEPGKMGIEFDKNNPDSIKLIGSKTQDELLEYNKFVEPVTKKIDPIWRNICLLKDSISKGVDPEKKMNIQERIDRLYTDKYQEQIKIPAYNVRFIKLHPTSYLSENLLIMLEKNETIPLDSVISLHSHLDVSVQNGFDGKMIQTDLGKKKNNRIGVMAPDFSLKDLNNKQVTLSEFRGKSVVLLDFWASWCGPCRRSFIKLKSVYNHLHSKGFEVIAIDADYSGNDKAWVEAIQKDSISMWYHVKVAKDLVHKITPDDIYAKYFVQGVPRKILIDKNGIIAGNWVGSDDATEKEVSDLIGKLVE